MMLICFMELLTDGHLMTEPSTPAEQPLTIPAVDQGMSIPLAVTITVISALVVGASSYAVIAGRLSAGMTRVFAVASLLALAALVYGVIELLLAIIATSSERRRKAREVTERRQGERARKPKR
jgi:membrane protein implicated in regulation of membrane protease activity